MEYNNSNEMNDSNKLNDSKGQDFSNQSSNNESAQFHEFEHKTSFNATKLEEEFGEIKKKLYSSK